MNKKKPVQFRPPVRTRRLHDKLRVCSRCGQYTALWEDDCAACGRPSLQTVRDKAAGKAKRSMQAIRLAVVLAALVAMLFAATFLQMALAAIAGALLVALLWRVQRQALPAETNRELSRLLAREQGAIIEGMIAGREAAAEAVRSGNERLGYEMLRELGDFIRSDRIRLQQLALLDGFVLRRDMQLALEPLMLAHFEPMLAAYIGELTKIRRELIKHGAIRYALTYERHIIEMDGGVEILTGVAGACLRMKAYVAEYGDFVRRYARLLPKERFLRLYNLTRDPSGDFPAGLTDEVMAIYHEKYQWDPDFR